MREFLLHPDLSDEDLAQILQAAGGDTLPASSRTPITEDERQIIAQSLGQLYQGEEGKVSIALQNALSRIVEVEYAMAQGPGNPFTDSPGRIARLIAESGSPRLKELYAIAIFERLDDTTGSQIMAEALAIIYINQPERLTTYFMGAALENIGNDGLPIIDKYEYNYGTRLAKFSRFWQYTLYSPRVSDETKSILAKAIGKAINAYHTMPSGLLLGRLAGTILGGFIQRVQEQQEQYKARLSMAKAVLDILKVVYENRVPPPGRAVADWCANGVAEIIARQLVEKRGYFGLGPWQHRDPGKISANAVLEELRFVFAFQDLVDTDGRRNGANSEQNNFSQGVEDVYLGLELKQYAWMK